MSRTLTIHPVTRIEGHAKITLHVDDQNQVVDANLQVLEMRGFEKLLKGMELFKVPLMAARICGVCPAAQHLAAVAAIEQGLGVRPPADGLALRELLYMGHILHSHALSVFLLCGPDLYAEPSAPPSERNVFHLLRMQPEMARQILRVRTIGQRVVELTGGRGVHPVTAVPGGMAYCPPASELETMAQSGSEAVAILEALGDALRDKLAALPEARSEALEPCAALALSHAGTVSFFEGEWTLKDRQGASSDAFKAEDYATHLVEHGAPGSYMKPIRLRGTPERSFFVGPLARLQVNTRLTTPKADALLQAFHAKGPRWSPTDFIEARLVEMMHAAERITALAGGGMGRGPFHTPCSPRGGRFIGAVEAPRGLLLHDYTADSDGRLLTANMIVATQHNYDAMNATLRHVGQTYLAQGDDTHLINRLEFALRCFDPCLACATHAVGQMPMEIRLCFADGSERHILRSAEP